MTGKDNPTDAEIDQMLEDNYTQLDNEYLELQPQINDAWRAANLDNDPNAKHRLRVLKEKGKELTKKMDAIEEVTEDEPYRGR